MSDADPFQAGENFVSAGNIFVTSETIVVPKSLLEDTGHISGLADRVIADLLPAMATTREPVEYVRPPEPGTPEYAAYMEAQAKLERQREWDRRRDALCLCDDARGYEGDWCPVHGREVQREDPWDY